MAARGQWCNRVGAAVVGRQVCKRPLPVLTHEDVDLVLDVHPQPVLDDSAACDADVVALEAKEGRVEEKARGESLPRLAPVGDDAAKAGGEGGQAWLERAAEVGSLGEEECQHGPGREEEDGGAAREEGGHHAERDAGSEMRG